MSTPDLTLLLLRIGFLVLLWFFVFAVVFALRQDLFGVRVRKLPATGAPATPGANAPPAPAAPKAPAPPRGATLATLSNANRLVIVDGPKAGLEIDLGREPLTIGRSSESGLVIRDDYTSSHHARLSLRGETWILQDLESTNGTWHDGERVTAPVPVRLGAPIRVGATTFELRN